MLDRVKLESLSGYTDRGRDQKSRSKSPKKKSKKQKKSKKKSEEFGRNYLRRESYENFTDATNSSRSPSKDKKNKSKDKSKKDRRRSRSPRKTKPRKERRSRSKEKRFRGKRNRKKKTDKKLGYKPASSCSSSDDWRNSSDDANSSDRSRGRKPNKRQRSRSRSHSSYSSSSSSERDSYGPDGFRRNGGYKGRRENWRGGGRVRGRGQGTGRGRNTFNPNAPTLRGRGYWRPNYIAYGRNIFPGGDSSETHSDSSRSISTCSSSRSRTPEHYKDTPDHSPEPPKREKTPEKGLMDTIQQQEIQRINAIMAQLEQQGKENAKKIYPGSQQRGQFANTFGEEKDIFEETEEPPQLRKEFKERSDFLKEKNASPPVPKKKTKLFDYSEEPAATPIPNLDSGMSLRKQMELASSKDKDQKEKEKQENEAAKQARIANRVGAAVIDVKQSVQENDDNSIINRKRKATNIRSELDNEQEEHVSEVLTKSEPNDAEFVQNLNKEFKKDRGFEIKLNMNSAANKHMSFSQLSNKMAPRGKKMAVSSGLTKSSFGVPKILGRRESQGNQFLKPNLEEHLESMNNSQENVLYKQRQIEAMEKQGEKVQESLTPIGSSSIGPIKPTVPTQAKRLNRTGVILPVNLLEKNSPSTPTTPVVTTPPVVPEQISVSGSSGSQMQSLSSSPSTRKNSIPAVQPAAGSVIFNVTRPPVPPSGAAFPPPPGVLHRFPPPQPNSSSGWKDGGWKDPPKSGWNDSPPRKDWAGSSTIPIHVTPNVTLSRVPPPPVIRREYSPSYPPPPISSVPPVIHRVYPEQKPTVILKREFDSDSEGPTPPPGPEPEIDLQDLYRRHPQLWQGFVQIKKHAAMVQLHYLSGDKILVQSVLPVFPTMTGSDNSKHPALKVTTRVKLDNTTFHSLRTKMRESSEYSLLLGLPCGVSEQDVENQKMRLRVNFMNYFTSKVAAGVVEIKIDGKQYLVYLFPACDLMREEMSKYPEFLKQTADLPQLMIAIFPSK